MTDSVTYLAVGLTLALGDVCVSSAYGKCSFVEHLQRASFECASLSSLDESALHLVLMSNCREEVRFLPHGDLFELVRVFGVWLLFDGAVEGTGRPSVDSPVVSLGSCVLSLFMLQNELLF